MAASRFVFHPVLLNKKSRLIFLLFLCVSVLIGAAVYWKFQHIYVSSGARTAVLSATELAWYIKFLLSPHFKFTLVLISAALAGTLTAHYVVGPIKRMEQWVLDWGNSQKVGPLQVRDRDKFTNFVRLLNELRAKLTPSSKD